MTGAIQMDVDVTADNTFVRENQNSLSGGLQEFDRKCAELEQKFHREDWFDEIREWTQSIRRDAIRKELNGGEMDLDLEKEMKVIDKICRLRERLKEEKEEARKREGRAYSPEDYDEWFEDLIHKLKTGELTPDMVSDDGVLRSWEKTKNKVWWVIRWGLLFPAQMFLSAILIGLGCAFLEHYDIQATMANGWFLLPLAGMFAFAGWSIPAFWLMLLVCPPLLVALGNEDENGETPVHKALYWWWRMVSSPSMWVAMVIVTVQVYMDGGAFVGIHLR